MKQLFLIITLFFVFINVWSQETEQDDQSKPKTQWKVNKEYDQDGNLIAYDSVYVRSYENLQGLDFDKWDSIMQVQAEKFKNIDFSKLDFSLPDFDFSDLDSLQLSTRELFQNFDMQKEMQRLKDDFEKMRQEFQNRREEVETDDQPTKNLKEHKL